MIVKTRISKESVLERVREEAALHASKLLSSDPTAFMRLEVTTPEDDFIQKTAYESLVSLVSDEARFHPSIVSTIDGDISNVVPYSYEGINFNMPSNFSTDLIYALEDGILKFVTHSALLKWYTTCGEEKIVELAAADVAADLQNISNILNTRNAPKRNEPVTEKQDGVYFE